MKSGMLIFNAVLLAATAWIYFPPQDVKGTQIIEDYVPSLRMSRLSNAIETMFATDRKSASKTFYFPNIQSSISPGAMRAFNATYNLCGRIFNCILYPTAKHDHQNLNRLVVVSREGFLDLTKRFPVSLEHSLHAINIVIWDENDNASDVCD